MTKLEEKIELMVNYGYQFIKTPYKFGGGDFSHFDCSGFVQEAISSVFHLHEDKNCQSLYLFYKDKWEERVARGSLLFFGKSLTAITHISIALGDIDGSMLEAGGGNQWTRTDEDAQKANAFVRIRPIARRKDFLMGLYPKE